MIEATSYSPGGRRARAAIQPVNPSVRWFK
jgi:hypothetical protein